jgi:hypothetical protein
LLQFYQKKRKILYSTPWTRFSVDTAEIQLHHMMYQNQCDGCDSVATISAMPGSGGKKQKNIAARPATLLGHVSLKGNSSRAALVQ